jgi:hypothetical protein
MRGVVSLLLLAVLCCWAHVGVSYGGTIISPFACQSANYHQPDTSPWLSVSRGPGFYVGNVFQYWLTQEFIYGIDATYVPHRRTHRTHTHTPHTPPHSRVR